MTVNDPIIVRNSRGSTFEVFDFATDNSDVARPANAETLRQWLESAYVASTLLGVDFAIVAAQAALETGNFSNRFFLTRYNSGSFGITGPAPKDEAGHAFRSASAGAIAHVVHLWAYTGNLLAPSAEGWSALSEWRHVDPRLDELMASATRTPVRTIAGLAKTWSTDPNYPQNLVNRGNMIFGKIIQNPINNQVL